MTNEDIVDIDSVLKEFNTSKMNTYFQTFMSNSSFEVGVLKIKPGQIDTQGQHSVDELYFVLEGSGLIRIKDKDHELKRGSCIFVRADTEHFFHGNHKLLVVLYIFNVSKGLKRV
jgi:mannose-6-phosphate isomerase-like protein (cupin superfamily)